MERGFLTRDIESGLDVADPQDPKDPQKLSTNSEQTKQKNQPITKKHASTMLDQVMTYAMNFSGKDSQGIICYIFTLINNIFRHTCPLRKSLRPKSAHEAVSPVLRGPWARKTGAE